tara:strand:+ start:119 stop:442 length:324 start_codon:yes stop_codon:yes gene_type:complete
MGRKSPLRSRSPKSPRASSPKKRSGLTQKIQLPPDVAKALKIKGEISYNQIPSALQKTIDQQERIQGDRNIPLKAISEDMITLLKIDSPVTDMELTTKLWEKIKANK